MQASMSEVVLPLDGRDDEELRHSTEMDQIGSSRRDESQLSSQIDEDTLEDVDIVIDHALAQYFHTTLPSVTQNEHQPSPPPRVTRNEVPVEQELSKTSEPKTFSLDSVEPNLVTIDRYGSAIDSNWDETETDFNYYLPNYAQEVVITTETNSPQAPDKGPTERLVAAPHDYSLDVIVPEKLGVQGFPFEEALNPLTAIPNSNPLQEESAFFDDMDLNPAGLKDCRSFYEPQTTEISVESSTENVSPGCSSMHIVPLSAGLLEVGTQSHPEELVGSVGLDVVGKNVIVEMNPSASPDVARVPSSNAVRQPISPPPSYRQTMAAAYQKTVYDPLSCCGPYGTVVKNKIVLSYSGEGVLSETDSRDSDYGPPKLDAIDDNHASTNDQPNDFPPMLEPADPTFSSAGKEAVQAVHGIPSAAGEALESIKKLSLGVVPENGQEQLEGSSQDELNECLGKLVPSITPEFSKQIPSSYIVNDMYNVRNITPESSTIASCVDHVGGLPDLLPVSEEPKLYRTFNKISPKKKKPETADLAATCSVQNKQVDKTVRSSLVEPANKFEGSSNHPKCASKRSVQDLRSAQLTNENMLSIAKREPSTSSGGLALPISPVTGMVKVAKTIPQQTPVALMHDSNTGRANFKIIPTTATTINLGVKKITIVKPQNMKDKIVLLKRATLETLSSSDLESMNLKKLTPVQSANLNKMLLPQVPLDNSSLQITIDSETPKLPTPSISSNSGISKEPKDKSSPSTVKCTPRVAVGKNAVALKVSLPLDLLSVKPSLVPDPPKIVSCDKSDGPIEKAVTADGEVDPNAIMDAMKVSAPFLFPVTKPEVTKKATKQDAGKTEQIPAMLKEKKKSAAPPVVVKMTSKANRKIFSPIREVEFTSEKSKSVNRPESSLAQANDTPNTKSVAAHPQPSSDTTVRACNRLSTSLTHGDVAVKESPAVKTNQSKQPVVISVANESKRKVLEPSLMKQVDNASDDLSSFLSSLSGPKERPKGVQNLEKVVHETIVAASACDVAVKSVAATKTTPADDPIIIPPSEIRKDDPLSLKVGLKLCKFRDVKKDEPSKKPLSSQVARSGPSSFNHLVPHNKPTSAVRGPPTTKTSVESQRTHVSSAENAKSKEAYLDHEEHTIVEPEEKVHPIVELVNQLIESNSKSPQIFSEPDKPRSEEVAKRGDEAKVDSGKTESRKDVFMNKEIRAKEDGMLAGVVKERTSKLIQKARDLVCDGQVASSEGKNHSTGKSTPTRSVGQSQVSSLEKQGETTKDHRVSVVETTAGEMDTKGVDGLLNKAAAGLGTSSKTILNLPMNQIEASVISNGPNGAEDHNVGAVSSCPPIAKDPSGVEHVKASVSEEMLSNEQNPVNLGFKSRVPKELEKEKTTEVHQIPTESPQSAHTLTEKSPKEQISATPERISSTKLRGTEGPATIGKAPEQLKETVNQESGKSHSNGKASTKEKPIVSKSLDEPKTAAVELRKQSTRKEVRKPSRPQEPSDVPVEALEALRVDKTKPQTVTAVNVPVVEPSDGLRADKVKENESPKNTPISTGEANNPREVLPQESVSHRPQTTGAVPACKASGSLNEKKTSDSMSALEADDSSEKAPSSKVKRYTKRETTAASKREPFSAGNSCSSEGATKKMEEGEEGTSKTGSSKRVISSTEKLPTQLIVSIPTVAISNQPSTLNLLIPSNGSSEGSKDETGERNTKRGPQTVESKKEVTCRDEPLKQKLPQSKPEAKAAKMVPAVKSLEEPNLAETTVTKGSTVNTSEKALPDEDSLSRKNVLAGDKRSSIRRKSKGEVHISLPNELKDKEGKDAKEPLGKNNSQEKCPEKATKKSNESNSVEKVDATPLKQHGCSVLPVSENVRDDQTISSEGSVGAVEDSAGHSIEKPAKLHKVPEKPSHRMRTRGSIPTPVREEETKAGCPEAAAKITETVDTPVESDCSNSDNLQLKSKILLQDKSNGRPRTRSETNNEKKILDGGCSENLEPVESGYDAGHDLQNEKALSKKPRGDTATGTVSRAVTAPSSADDLREQKQESTGETPPASVRARGKIERKPVTVKPIAATPKKGYSKLPGSHKSIDDSDELDTAPCLSDQDGKPAANAENNAEMSGVNGDRTTPTKTSSSQKNNLHGSAETNPNVIVESKKPLSVSQKLITKKISRVPKQPASKKNRRVSMKPKKVAQFETSVKPQVNDVYDFTEDEGQSFEIQTIDTFRKVTGKSTKNTKTSVDLFESSQESLFSEEENKSNDQIRTSRSKNVKTVPGAAKRRASPRKSMSEPRKSEFKKGTDIALKNALSESTESLLSNTGETVLPPELQENLRNSRSESIRLAKQSQALKKSPVRKLSTSADAVETKAPQLSNGKGNRRFSRSRTPSVENCNTVAKKGGNDLEHLLGSGNKSAVAKEETNSKMETRETRRSLAPSCGDKHANEASKKDSGKSEVAKVVTTDSTRKRSPQKKDVNVVENTNRDATPENPAKTPSFESANSTSESRSKTDHGNVSHISTRSKSRESLNEEDNSSTRSLRNKGIIQTAPAGLNVPEVSNSSKSNHEKDPVQSSSTKVAAAETAVDQVSSVRMGTRSKTIENEPTGNNVPKPSAISEESAFLPKLRSSAGKKAEIFRKTTHKEVEVQSPVPAEGNVSEILANNVESVNQPIALDKWKKTKKSDPLLFSSAKDDPVEHISGVVSKALTVSTVDTTGKERHRRPKKGGVAGDVSDMILAQAPLLTQDMCSNASRNAEAVSLKTPPMDATAAQELDNVQPVGAMSQHGEPEGAKSTTRTAQLHSLVVPVDEVGAGNSMGLLRKKNKKLVVVEKKNMAQSSPISYDKSKDGGVIAGKANDAAMKSGTERSDVDCLIPPVKFETRRTRVEAEVIPERRLSRSGGSSSESEKGESSKVRKHATDVDPNVSIKSARRITRFASSTKILHSASKDEQECVPTLNNSASDLSDTETTPCRSKRKQTLSREDLLTNSSVDPVTERVSKRGHQGSAEGEESIVPVPADMPLLNNGIRSEDVQVAANDTCKTVKTSRGKKPKAGLKQSPLAEDEIKSSQPKTLTPEKHKGTSVQIKPPGSCSGKNLSPFEKNLTLNSKPSTKKDVPAKPTSYLLPKVGRVKTNTKDVCEISGEAEKLFEEASLDGREGFDVIVPSPGKSPDSTTQHSSEIIIPVLSSELDTSPNAKIPEDAHGVTSTTELGNVVSDSERKMQKILLDHFGASELSSKKEDESVSSTTVDSTKPVDANVESALEPPAPLKETPSTPIVDLRCNQLGESKVLSKRAAFPGETVALIPEHPKKIWRVNPVLEVPLTPTESTPKVVGSLDSELSCIIKPHITDEELRKTPLKKRQVWAYAACCNSNDNVKSQFVTKGSIPVEGDPPVVHSTNDASPSSGTPTSSPVGVSSNVSPKREDGKKPNEVLSSGSSSVDRISHSIIKILAASTEKMFPNDITIEHPSQGVGSSGSESSETKGEKLVANSSTSKSQETFAFKRKINRIRRAGLRSINSRLAHKRHLRNRRGKLIKKRYKVVQKPEPNHRSQKSTLSPSPASTLTDKAGEKKNSSVGLVNQDRTSAGSEQSSERAGNKIVDLNENCAPNASVQHPTTTKNCLIVPNSSKGLEHVEQTLKVSSPANDKCAELTVDTTDQEIEGEEAPPYSPIAPPYSPIDVDTTKETDWKSHANSASVDCGVSVERNSPVRLTDSFQRLNAPPEDASSYQRPHKTERIRSYSNDEPDRSHIYVSRPRSRRKSHPENPVDLSHPGNPVFGMKIPSNVPKLDLTGMTPVYHAAPDQATVPYDLIPTTLIRHIPSPSPSFAPPQRLMPVHGPIRPIPTLGVTSPVTPFPPMAAQFAPSDKARIELSSRMNAYSVSAFHSTKKKSSNPNSAGHRKADYNPLLFAQENYILNAGLSSVMPSLPSAVASANSPSSLLKPSKSRSGRGRIDNTATPPSTWKSGVANMRATPPDSAESPTRDVRLHEAQIQLLMSNPELSISRTTPVGNAQSLIPGNRVGSPQFDAKKSKPLKSLASSGCMDSVQSTNRIQENQRVDVDDVIEPLDVVTCELHEEKSDPLVRQPRFNSSGATLSPSTALQQQTPKIAQTTKGRNEPKRTPVSVEQVLNRNEQPVDSVSSDAAITADDSVPKKKRHENVVGKTGSTSRRRISILDACKSHKKKSSAAVNTQSLFDSNADRNYQSPFSTANVADDKEFGLDSKTTKDPRESKQTLSTCSDVLKSSTAHRNESKRVFSPFRKTPPSNKLNVKTIEPPSSVTETTVESENKNEEASTKPGGPKAKEAGRKLANAGPHPLVGNPGLSSVTEKSNETSCKELEAPESVVPEPAQQTRAILTDGDLTKKKNITETEITEKPKTVAPCKPVQLGSSGVTLGSDEPVNSTQEREKVEPAGLENDKRIISKDMTDKVTKQVAKPLTDGKPNVAKSISKPKTDSSVNADACSRLKPDGISKPSSKSVILNKVELTASQGQVVAEKTVLPTQTDAMKVADGLNKLESGCDAKLVSGPGAGKAPIVQKSGLIEKPTPELKTETSNLGTALNEFKAGETSASVTVTDVKNNATGRTEKTGEISASTTVPDVKQHKPSIVHKAGEDAKFIPTPKTDTSNLTDGKLETDISIPSSETVTDGKPNERDGEIIAPTPKINLVSAHAELGTDGISKAASEKISESKQNEVGPTTEDCEKSVPVPLAAVSTPLKSDEGSKADSQTTGVGNPRPEVVGESVLKAKLEGKTKEAVDLPSATVEKPMPELKTVDNTKEGITDPERSTADSDVEPTIAIAHQHTSDHLYCAKMETIRPQVISEPKVGDHPETISTDTLDSKPDHKNATILDTDDSLTKASTEETNDKLEPVNMQGNGSEPRVGGVDDTNNRVLCTDEPITEFSSKSAEEPRNAEDVPLAVPPEADTSTNTEKDPEGPSIGHLQLESNTKLEDRLKAVVTPEPCPPKELNVPTKLDGKEVTDCVASKEVISSIEIEERLIPTPLDTLVPSVGKSEQETTPELVENFPKQTQQADGKGAVVETEFQSAGITDDQRACPNQGRRPKDENILPKDLAVPSEQSGETEEPIRSVAVELTEGKIVDEVDHDGPTLSLEEREEGKLIATDSSAAVEQECNQEDVGALAAVRGKDDSERSAEDCLEREVEAEEHAVGSEVVTCAKKEDVASSGGDVVADVTVSAETTESTSAAAVGQVNTSTGVEDFPSSELLPVGNTGDVSEKANSREKVEVQEPLGVSKITRDEITSTVTKSNETPSVPERSIVDPTQEKSHTPAVMAPSSPPKSTVVETPPQSPANDRPTEPEDVSGSVAHEKVGEVPGDGSNSLSERIGHPETVPVVCDLGEKPSSAPGEGKFIEGNSSTGSSSLRVVEELSSLKPRPPEERANHGKSTNSEGADDTKALKCSSQISNVDAAKTVPDTTTPATPTIVQPTDDFTPLLLESTETPHLKERGGNRISGVTKISTNRPERKRKRPAWLEDGPVSCKLNKSAAVGTPFEVDCPGVPGGKIRLDPSVPKVKVEVLCQSVVRKLQENLGVSIHRSDLAKLQKCWAEFRSSLSKGAQVEKPNESIVTTRKSSTTRLCAFDHARPSASFDHAKPSTSQRCDYSPVHHTSRLEQEEEEEDDDVDEHRGLAKILRERMKLAQTSILQPPPSRGQKRTVSQAFAQNANIYKDPRVRSASDRTGGAGRRQLLPFEIPTLPSMFPIRQTVLPASRPIRQPHQISYSSLLELLRVRRMRNEHRESDVPAQPYKTFVRPQEEYTRPSLREVYNSFAGEHSQQMVGYLGRMSAVHEVPLATSTPSSSTSRIPTYTISSDSEDSNPGNPEDTVNERDEVRRRIRRKSNTPAVSSCSCPGPSHGAYRTVCPSCRKERFQATGAISPVRSSRPPLYAEIPRVEQQESARAFGKRAATVGEVDDTIIDDSEDSVRRIKNLLVAWPSDPNPSDGEPPIRVSFTSYQKDVSLPHVTVSSCPLPQSSSIAHPPPDMERVAGASFQKCLQQKPFSERGRPQDSSDNVQHDMISTEYPTTSRSHPATSAGDQSCVPDYDGPSAKKKKS